MDRRGVTGFPMRLVAAAVLLSLCVPVLAEAADGFREQTCEKEAMGQISVIEEVSTSLYFSGPGASRVVGVSVPAGYELWIGGDGTDAYAISLMYGDVPVRKVFMEHPAFSFSEGCTKVTGTVSLRLECRNDGGTCSVGVAVL